MASKYDDEFKRQAVAAYRKQIKVSESQAAALRVVAAEFNIPVGTLRGWVKAAGDDPGPSVEIIPPSPTQNGDRSPSPHVVEIVGAPDPESLEGAYVEAVGEMNWLTDTDKALVRMGREYARQIDDVLRDPTVDKQTKTKTLYLGPHLIGTLKELGGTPGSRQELTRGGDTVGGKLAALRSVENSRGKKRA